MNRQIPAAVAAQIEKGVPLPQSNSGVKPGQGKYEAAAWLNPGESFFLPRGDVKAARQAVATLLRRRSLDFSMVYRAETLDGVAGARIWRKA